MVGNCGLSEVNRISSGCRVGLGGRTGPMKTSCFLIIVVVVVEDSVVVAVVVVVVVEVVDVDDGVAGGNCCTVKTASKGLSLDKSAGK